MPAPRPVCLDHICLWASWCCCPSAAPAQAPRCSASWRGAGTAKRQSWLFSISLDPRVSNERSLPRLGAPPAPPLLVSQDLSMGFTHVERLGIAGAVLLLQQHEGLSIMQRAAVLGQVCQGVGPFPSRCPGVGTAIGGQRASPTASKLQGKRRGLHQSNLSIPTPCTDMCCCIGLSILWMEIPRAEHPMDREIPMAEHPIDKRSLGLSIPWVEIPRAEISMDGAKASRSISAWALAARTPIPVPNGLILVSMQIHNSCYLAEVWQL